MRTHGGLTEHSRTDSLNAPIGKRKGREGKGTGRGNATAIWSLADVGQVALHLKSLRGRQDAMHEETSWL